VIFQLGKKNQHQERRTKQKATELPPREENIYTPRLNPTPTISFPANSIARFRKTLSFSLSPSVASTQGNRHSHEEPTPTRLHVVATGVGEG
jgi:hypothetical protein